MKKPKNQTAEVLYELIKRGKITRQSIMKSCGILNVTARISNLRNRFGLDVICKEVPVVNKYGRDTMYGEWSLSDPEEAELLYSKINRES